MSSQNQDNARRLAEELFTNGDGERASHLELRNSSGAYLGGWSMDAAQKLIASSLESAPAPLAVPDEVARLFYDVAEGDWDETTGSAECLVPRGLIERMRQFVRENRNGLRDAALSLPAHPAPSAERESGGEECSREAEVEP